MQGLGVVQRVRDDGGFSVGHVYLQPLIRQAGRAGVGQPFGPQSGNLQLGPLQRRLDSVLQGLPVLRRKQSCAGGRRGVGLQERAGVQTEHRAVQADLVVHAVAQFGDRDCALHDPHRRLWSCAVGANQAHNLVRTNNDLFYNLAVGGVLDDLLRERAVANNQFVVRHLHTDCNLQVEYSLVDRPVPATRIGIAVHHADCRDAPERVGPVRRVHADHARVDTAPCAVWRDDGLTVDDLLRAIGLRDLDRQLAPSAGVVRVCGVVVLNLDLPRLADVQPQDPGCVHHRDQ